MRESLLQYIWQHMLFDPANLVTTCGREVNIVYQGDLNDGDGPDFRQARIRLDGIWFFGDIELHTDNKLWYTHRHHEDPAYNRVILHVVLDTSPSSVQRQDGTDLPTLSLSHALSESVAQVIQQKSLDSRLPCASQVTDISPEVIRHQFEQARREYFDYRANQLMRFYDANLPPFQAWQHMTALALFEGLGYSKNRNPMITFGEYLLAGYDRTSLSQLSESDLYELAGVNKNSPRRLPWDFSASRPANQPRMRIIQAHELLKALLSITRTEYLHTDINKLWEKLLSGCRIKPGQTRLKQLYQVVWLPGIYLMGTLCASDRLKTRSYQLWEHEKGGVPEQVLKNFINCGMGAKNHLNHPGAIYQYKYMCQQHQCSRCDIMKNIISS